MRFEKFVPVAFAPRLKEPLCSVSISDEKTGEGRKTHVEPGVRCALRVDERGFDFEDDAGLCRAPGWYARTVKRGLSRTIFADADNPLLDLPAGSARCGKRLQDLNGLATVHL